MPGLATLNWRQLREIDEAIAAIRQRSPDDRKRAKFLLRILEAERAALLSCISRTGA